MLSELPSDPYQGQIVSDKDGMVIIWDGACWIPITHNPPPPSYQFCHRVSMDDLEKEKKIKNNLNLSTNYDKNLL